MSYLIIGNSAAGIGAVEGIREVDTEGEITLISDEPYHSYSRPLISYYLAGKVEEEGMKYRPDDFYEQHQVKTKLGKKVVSVNEAEQQVTLESGEQLEYQQLLLATGGTPFIPPIKEADKKNIYTFIKLDEAKEIASKVEELQLERAVILGAGLIGLKAAEALRQLGVEVTVIELANQVLSAILDEEAAALVQQHLEEQGIEFIFEDTIEEFLGIAEVEGVKLKSGKELRSQLAIIAVGVRPNVELATGTEIEIEQGIVVNQKQQTNIEGIYAAGDVCQGPNPLQNENTVVPIWPNAYNQGLIAGKNMAGESAEYQQNFPRNSIGFFGLSMITAGLIKPEDDSYELLISKCEESKCYQKIVLKDNQIVGFIRLNDVDRAGILTGLLKEGADISKVKSELLSDSFGYISFDEEWRQAKISE
ncbi:NAD(P)/FAD-dependent oxidoreductase [Fuchsiella alkaliacetigena]|uniref:NAD(P)/FAD-dependent oxidoreductase n=1 Tax=Fuchsiella alkaliacetigena TaxID=957042 RepID=UPI00200A82F3|nr:FAD-dependent oxidoreductase [Fuchsiella alkaliacetigena]MCK8824772.1 FAD-dependent oxidoreductase [Fuchsiella alkaliacetigena]